MTKLSAADVEKKKMALLDDILALVRAFNAETGATVEWLALDRSFAGDDVSAYVAQIDTDVDAQLIEQGRLK